VADDMPSSLIPSLWRGVVGGEVGGRGFYAVKVYRRNPSLSLPGEGIARA